MKLKLAIYYKTSFARIVDCIAVYHQSKPKKSETFWLRHFLSHCEWDIFKIFWARHFNETFCWMRHFLRHFECVKKVINGRHFVYFIKLLSYNFEELIALFAPAKDWHQSFGSSRGRIDSFLYFFQKLRGVVVMLQVASKIKN